MAAPMSAAIVVSAFPIERRGRVLGLLAAAIAAGRVTGPAIGGFLLYLWGWRAIFLLNFFIGVLVSVSVFRVFRHEEKGSLEGFDLWGTFSLLLGYPALLLALSLGARSDWKSTQIPLWFALSLLGWVSFVITEFRVQKPLIRPSFFRSIPFSAAILALGASSALYHLPFQHHPKRFRNTL